jgi:PAS domain S-box-containing protein
MTRLFLLVVSLLLILGTGPGCAHSPLDIDHIFELGVPGVQSALQAKDGFLCPGSDDLWGAFSAIVTSSPYWKTWWFWGVIIVLLGGAGLAIYHAHLAAINRQRRLLECQIKERATILESQQVRLQESESRARALAEATFEGIVIHDNGLILDVNQALQEMFGYHRDELIGRNALDFLSSRSRQTALRYIRTGCEKPYEAEGIKKDGARFPIEVRGRAMRDQDRMVRVAALRDLTERKQMQERLLWAKNAAEAASRAKSEFLNRMSHELKTPMNIIIGMTFLTLQTDLTPKQQTYLDSIENAADTLLQLINDLLDFSGLETGDITIQMVEFSLSSILEYLFRRFQPKARAKDLTLHFDIDPAVPFGLIGDPIRLKQILLNLLDNGLKFTETGQVKLDVSVLDVSDTTDAVHVQLLFAVQDTGIGIPPEKLPILFGVFTQVDGSSTRKYGGTGLGLAICQRLITMMDGHIRVESEPQRGSTFYVTLPFNTYQYEPQPEAPLWERANHGCQNPATTGSSTENSLRSVTEVDLETITPLVADLYDLLQTGDTEAVERVTLIRKYLVETSLADQVERLETRITHYDFEKARKTLKAIAQDLQILLPE